MAADDEERVTRADLLASAARDGNLVSDRQLAWWRSKGLVARPERTAHGDRLGVWTYPVRATQQARVLGRLHRDRDSPRDLAAGMLVAGVPPEEQTARAALVDHLDAVESVLRSQPPYAPLVSWAPPFAHAAAVARDPALPRLWRMSVSDRTKAFALVVLLMLGEHDGLSPDEFADGERCFERLTGLHLARRAVRREEPWLTGHSLDRFGEVASLPVLRRVAMRADHQQLEQAARSAHRIRRLLPVAALVIEGWDPRRGRGGMEALMDLDMAGPTGEAMWISYFLSIHQSRLAPNLAQIEWALEPYDEVARLLDGLLERPVDLVLHRLERLPTEGRRIVERTLSLARGRLSDEAGRRPRA